MKLSTVILTHNSEKTLDRAINSVPFSDEIVVIDDNSEDHTRELARRLKATVFERNLADDFANQRNFGLDTAKGNWILFLDSDEEISVELAEEIKQVLSRGNSASAYRLKRSDFMYGREMKHGETSKARAVGIVRLVKKNSGKWVGNVHEEFKTNHTVDRLKGYIKHQAHESVASFLNKVNRYSTIRARELRNNGKHFSLFELILYPPAKFVSNFFLKLGFLDGAEGFIYAFMMSFHSFLVRAKLMNV